MVSQGKGEEERGGGWRGGEDTFEKIVWSDMEKYGVWHFVKEQARGGGGDKVMKKAGGW